MRARSGWLRRSCSTRKGKNQGCNVVCSIGSICSLLKAARVALSCGDNLIVQARFPSRRSKQSQHTGRRTNLCGGAAALRMMAASKDKSPGWSADVHSRLGKCKVERMQARPGRKNSCAGAKKNCATPCRLGASTPATNTATLQSPRSLMAATHIHHHFEQLHTVRTIDR
jgi:hypothetical protein